MQTESSAKALARWRFAVLLWLLAGLVVIVAVVLSGIFGFIAATTAFALGKYGAPWDWPRRIRSAGP